MGFDERHLRPAAVDGTPRVALSVPHKGMDAVWSAARDQLALARSCSLKEIRASLSEGGLRT